MYFVLSDYNCEGQARAIVAALSRQPYADLVPVQLLAFRDVGLPSDASDEAVWRFCQDHDYLLLSGNRSGKGGERSLETVVRRLTGPTTLPVLTIGDLDRVLTDGTYCLRCAERLADILFTLDTYRGVPRLYL